MSELTARDQRRILENLVDETNEVYRRLAKVERKHADRWARRRLDDRLIL